MVAQGGGVFGITGATASWRGVKSTPAFASAKFGVRALAQSLCKTYAAQGVHVFHCVIDGIVDQPRTRSWFPADKPDDEFLSPARAGARISSARVEKEGVSSTRVEERPPRAGLDRGPLLLRRHPGEDLLDV